MRINCTYGRLAEIDELRPNPNNPNQHTEEQLGRLAKILEYQGWRHPIVVSKRSGLVVSGHGRLLASRLAGFTEVPIDEQDYNSDEEEMADLIADNKIAELAEWNAIRLNDQLANLNVKLEDIELSGYSDIDLSELAEGLFSPSLDPAHANTAVSEQDVNAVSTALSGEYSGAPKQDAMRSVTCPSCGEEFSINVNEIPRPPPN